MTPSTPTRMEQIGDATLYLGDCLEILPTLPAGAVEVAVTSPPYNLGEGMEDKGGLRVGHAGSKWVTGSCDRATAPTMTPCPTLIISRGSVLSSTICGAFLLEPFITITSLGWLSARSGHHSISFICRCDKSSSGTAGLASIA